MDTTTTAPAQAPEHRVAHAEAQKRYRESLKERLGEEGYRAYLRDTKRKQRDAARKRSMAGAVEPDGTISDPIVAGKVDDKAVAHVRKILASAPARNGKPLRDSTIGAYLAKLQRVAILATGAPLTDDFSWLKNYDDVIKALTRSGLGVLKDYLSPVCRILPHVFPDEKELLEKYRKQMAKWSDENLEERKKNEPTDKEASLFVPLPELQKRIRTFDVKDDMDLVSLVIVSMYLMGGRDSLVPRNNLAEFRIASSKKKVKDLNKDFNYLVCDVSNDMKPVGVIMQRYKNEEKWGRQKFGLSDFQRDVLHRYIREWKKQAGDTLFVNRNGQPFKVDTFRDLIEQATKRVVGTPLNVNLLRKIVVSDFYARGPHSIQDEEAFHRRLLHTPEMGRTYMKVSFAKRSKAAAAANALVDEDDE